MAKKPATKKAPAPAKKEASKPIKKEPKTAPAKKETKSTTKGSKLLELGLLCDCTSSMHSWIDRAKKTL